MTKLRKLPPLVQGTTGGKVVLCLPRASYLALGLYLTDMANVGAQPLPLLSLEDGDTLTQHLIVAYAAQLLHARHGFQWPQPFNRFVLPRAAALTLLGVLWGAPMGDDYLIELRNRLHQTLC